jgi:hypothetical protein
VSDEGHGIQDTPKAIQHAFASLAHPLASSCIVQGLLLLRTTNLSENTIRSYHIISSPTTDSTTQQTFQKKMQVIEMPIEQEKVFGIQFSGSQATLFFSSLAVPPDAALAACQQLLSMVSTLCPPVHLVLKAQNLLVVDENNENNILLQPQLQQQQQQEGCSQAGSAVSTTITTTLPTLRVRVKPTTFSRQVEPLPDTTLLTPMQRLKAGLLGEFPSSETFPSSPSPPMPLSSSQKLPAPVPALLESTSLPLLSFVGVGEGAVPRGCRWKACAGVVLQLPDHDAISTSQQLHQYHCREEREGENRVVVESSETQQGADAFVPTPAYLFQSHALQFEEKTNYIDALRRVNWSGHGFKLRDIRWGGSGASSTPAAAAVVEEQGSVDPIAVVLQCEQPESKAFIAAIVVHLYCPITEEIAQTTPSSQDGSNAFQQQQRQKRVSCTPRVAPCHRRTLIRTAIDAALADLKQQCRSVISDRRERSLMKALPVVSSSVAGILSRALGENVLIEACQALRVREVGELANTLHRKLEEVVIYTQQQQREQQQRVSGNATAEWR